MSAVAVCRACAPAGENGVNPFAVAGWSEIFGNPVTVALTAATLGIVLGAAIIIFALSVTGRIAPALQRELRLRLFSWIALLPLMLGPVLAGKGFTIAAVTLLGVLCLREYDRATGLFREYTIVAVVLLGVLAVNFAALDHWYGLFVALAPLTVGVIAVASIPGDRPDGYIQRTALGIFAFMLFGAGLAHLGYMANDRNYRPIVLLLLTAVALNDVRRSRSENCWAGRNCCRTPARTRPSPGRSARWWS